MTVFDDTTPRYVPQRILCKGNMLHVLETIAHSPNAHPEGCPLVKDCCALELVTVLGSRWFGCESAYIDSRLRMVAIGCSSQDEVRMAWMPVADAIDLDDFTRAFLECALWSTNDESDDRGGEPMDANYTIDDFDSASLAGLVAECTRFQAENASILESVDYRGPSDESTETRAGHDFWLTRNGHGAGFWDGDWPEPQASILDKASQEYGEVNLYVGDDNKIYASGYEDYNNTKNNEEQHA